MRLSSVEVIGYRSFSQRAVLHLDPNVTVVIGANDHGKTNLLEALTHLNKQTKFDKEKDLNWDYGEQPEEFPYINFTFQLDDDDRAEILRVAQEKSVEVAKATTSANATVLAAAAQSMSPHRRTY